MKKVAMPLGDFMNCTLQFEAEDYYLDGSWYTKCEFFLIRPDGRVVVVPVAPPIQVMNRNSNLLDMRVDITKEDVDFMLQDSQDALRNAVSMKI